ncbi:uncharacterized protein LOC133285806 [Gastrolobium bilobum]|uniref:uncharacterized protein LOC133285806 n=1 Tax=Gastrolobium bilobum TaxID=150636 RepID=UPI002AB25975|nr:uncharacterized protein LOC133285806 [Gastrolobium bilobum]
MARTAESRVETYYDSHESEADNATGRNQPKKPNSGGPWFTFDDISPHLWRKRLLEFGAWIDTKLLAADADPYKVMEEFCSRMIGSLKEWYHNLGSVRQDQLHQVGTSSGMLGVLHQEFIGDGDIIDKKNRQEFFEMKCCSLKIKDLERHFKRMMQKFYLLNGYNDPSLKNTYVASLPKEIQPELNKMAIAQGKDFTALTMGQIHQLTLEVVDKLCKQHKYMTDLMNQRSKYTQACKKPYLEIKCKDSNYDCGPKKKNHFKKYNPKQKGRNKKNQKQYRFFKKKKFRGKNRGQRCFICKKKGHFAKNCPNKSDKVVKMITALNLDEGDAESLYSEQSTGDEDTVFALQDSSSNSDSDVPVFAINEVFYISPEIPKPSVEVHILSSKFSHPKKVIAFMDTGAARSMMDPKILPPEAWKKETTYFIAADGKAFRTNLITKHPIGIRFFPECVIWTNVIGTRLSDKDILIGMDVYTKAKKLQILPQGIRFKRDFKPYSETSKLYALSEAPPELDDIKGKLLPLCTENHGEFSHPNPLWKNEDFFVQLPFKLNEDINPTKATHPGMSPSDLILARIECQELLKQGLIEPTKSPWACQAFYVEKRSEKIRGKKRLVIDYRPLNHFLQDDKFPIPKVDTLPILFKDAHIFSKFDMKAGFWQLGLDPADRYKTAFCIPNAQYQWKVLPFGLKVAPSLFQKAMTRIFAPLLDTILIYIDDVLLFSKNMEEHRKLLNQFAELANQHGLMLSEKKIHIAQTEVDFLGMHFSKGMYQPQPHIAKGLAEYPDENLTFK